MYSPPQSQHRCMRIFYCWMQCCRSSSNSLFMSSITFAFTTSMDSNLVPFKADMISGNIKKSDQGQLSTVNVPTQWSCALSKTLTDRALCASTLSWWRNHEPFFRSSSHPFMKGCQNLLVVDLVNGQTFRHPTHMNNPLDVEKKIIIPLNLDLLCRTVFCVGELGLFQCLD
jgi:hypothetical protein